MLHQRPHKQFRRRHPDTHTFSNAMPVLWTTADTAATRTDTPPEPASYPPSRPKPSMEDCTPTDEQPRAQPAMVTDTSQPGPRKSMAPETAQVDTGEPMPCEQHIDGDADAVMRPRVSESRDEMLSHRGAYPEKEEPHLAGALPRRHDFRIGARRIVYWMIFRSETHGAHGPVRGLRSADRSSRRAWMIADKI